MMATPNTGFWATVISTQGESYVTVVLQAVTLGQTDLVTEIKKQLMPVDVTALGNMTSADWLDFFTKHETLLPNFAGHGSVQQRTENFVQRLQKFFTVSSSITSSAGTNPFPVPGFGLSPGDPFYSFLREYKKIQSGTDLDFANDPDVDVIQKALANVFPEPGPARSWLKRVVDTIYALVKMTTFADIGELQFSTMEALYSRGYTTIEKVASLTADQFQAALLGTVAYVNADNIRKQCVPAGETILASDPESKEVFVPINPDGSLTDCIPPPNLSPLGMVQYLHEVPWASWW
jgi:hypothetical protein